VSPLDQGDGLLEPITKGGNPVRFGASDGRLLHFTEQEVSEEGVDMEEDAEGGSTGVCRDHFGPSKHACTRVRGCHALASDSSSKEDRLCQH
jgi:hypothetical protein